MTQQAAKLWACYALFNVYASRYKVLPFLVILSAFPFLYLYFLVAAFWAQKRQTFRFFLVDRWDDMPRFVMYGESGTGPGTQSAGHR